LKRVSGLQQERAVVADVVDDGELFVVRGLPEAAAELLEPEDAGLGGPEHEDGVELREVEAFVEDVHGAQACIFGPRLSGRWRTLRAE